jgi:hypothetical protein
MPTKKKATPAEGSAPATPARKFPAGARKKKADADEAPAAKAAPVDAAPVAAEPVVEVSVEAPSEDAIRARAWAIWRMHGGTPMQNWLRAEAELRAEAPKA